MRKDSKIITHLKQWSDGILDFFYPDICQFCQNEKAGKPEGYICPTCRAKNSPIELPICEVCGSMFSGNFEGTQHLVCSDCKIDPPYFDWARSTLKTGGTVLEAIHKFKYGRRCWVENWLGELLSDCADRWIRATDWDMIVPVPLHVSRKKERGFNQSERLARILAHHLELPLETKLVARVKRTPTQTDLSREERTENLKGAFEVSADYKDKIDGARIIVVDDVLTTGATCSAVAKQLKKAKAAYVCVLTVCRGVLS